MYNEVKSVMCGDTKVHICEGINGEYYAEWDDDNGDIKTMPCGKNDADIYNALSEEFGEQCEIDGDTLIRMADEIERSITVAPSYDVLADIIAQYLAKRQELLPPDAGELLMHILRYRIIPGVSRSVPLKTLEQWLDRAVQTQTIYRITDENNDDQPVRILHALRNGDDLLLELELLWLDTDAWVHDGVVLKHFNDITIKHFKSDELPPQYIEE